MDDICSGAQALRKLYEDYSVRLFAEQLTEFTERFVNSTAYFTIHAFADEELITLRNISGGICQ